MEEKEFILRLRSGPVRAGDDPVNRLKLALKALSRRFGLICVDYSAADIKRTEKKGRHAG